MTTVKGGPMSIRCVLGAAVCAALLAALAGAAPANAASAWWHLTSISRPAPISTAPPADEVQKVTVTATLGAVELRKNGSAASFKFDATHEEVQEALESIYGAGNVGVAGGPGGSEPYTVTFIGDLSDQPVEVMRGENGATVSEVTRGRNDGQIVMTAANVGDAVTSGAGAPVTLAGRLPHGLRAVVVEGVGLPGDVREEGKCSVATVSCTFEQQVPPYQQVEVTVSVVAEAGAESGFAEASVSGGEAPFTSVRRPVAVGGAPAPFGVQAYELTPETEGGGLDTQAGSHPFQLTTTTRLNQTGDWGRQNLSEVVEPVTLAKDLNFKLPPGLVGNPTPMPQCTLLQFLTFTAGNEANECPQQTAVGVALTTFDLSVTGYTTSTTPVFNLEPEVGEPARFGFVVKGSPVYLDTSLRTGGDYGVTVSVDNITQTVAFVGSQLTLWGVPGDFRHNDSRGWGCMYKSEGGEVARFAEQNGLVCLDENTPHPPPFLSLPTECAGPLQTSVEADSWRQPGVFGGVSTVEPMGTLDGCNRLPFAPSIKVTPDGQAGSTPTGLTVDEHVSQTSTLDGEGLAESDVKGLSVTLPEGVALNPAAADGLQACSLEGIGLQSGEASSCSEAAKVATVKIRTPLLPEPLEGAAYLATQDANPFGSLVAMYIEAYNPISGVRAKATGEVVEDPVTGQLTAHFEGDPVFEDDPAYANDVAAQFLPETPFEDVELHFFGGDRAPLATPAKCGAYTTTGTFTPWSGNPTTESSSTFDIVSGPNGTPCSDPLPFSPTLTAGTTSIQAGGFTPFEMTMSREDGEQNLQGVQLKMPLGMSGTLSSVKLCGEEQANAGTCGPESEIGETTVSVGVGGDPYTVKGGRVYITGPYKGAPFGLSIVNPAKAGPFNLGQVIVRAKIEVNPETAALTITTDNEGPYKIPTIIDGIPLQIKHVNVDVNRPGFTFNATNCSPLAITGSLVSTEGSTSALSVPYQVTNCAVLAFEPKLEASTSAKTSRAGGASLHVKLGYPAGPYDANIAKVKVELPKALPSRLTTLQKACTAAVFEANPAACPAASIVGHATATTPVLPVPLSGPAYFVSHGGEAFPSLIIVLQGYGVTVHLVGSTFIDKAGITSSTFKTVPDVPVGTFELTLPEGQFSALAANGNLCKKSLAMPTEFVGQNGALIETSTKIAVTGCGKVKHKAKKASEHHKGKRGAKAKGKQKK